MARLIGVDLPREKRLEIALTYIFGVGRPARAKPCPPLGSVATSVSTNSPTSNSLRFVTTSRPSTRPKATCAATSPQTFVARSRSAPTRAVAIAVGCPVRGQRTRTNARTRKGKKKAVAGKKKVR